MSVDGDSMEWLAAKEESWVEFAGVETHNSPHSQGWQPILPGKEKETPSPQIPQGKWVQGTRGNAIPVVT